MASTDEPKRAPFKIDHIVAFIAADPETGDEGIIGTMTPNGWVPLIASDRVRLEDLKVLAGEIAREGNMRVTFCRFSVRTEEGIIDGRN
jgi:hypothetical protein